VEELANFAAVFHQFHIVHSSIPLSVVGMKDLIDPKVSLIYYEVIIFPVRNLNLLLLKRHKVSSKFIK
jgi:hypothetical protein